MNLFDRLSNAGTANVQNSYERGIILLSNKASLLIPLMICIFFLPFVFLSKFTIPVLLINSIFYPLTLLLNYKRQYTLARHYLIVLLIILIGSVLLIRGINSGILFLTIPLMLLLVIFFYRQRSFAFYLGVLASMLVLVFLFDAWIPTLASYSPTAQNIVYPLLLLICLILSALFINFFIQESQRYQSELMELNRVKTRLLSIIGHDMRAPLNSLQATLQLLNEKHLSQEEFYMLSRKLQISTEQVTYTLNNLLHWARTQLEGFRTNPVEFDLSTIVEEKVLLYTEMAQDKKLTLKNEIPAATFAFADVDQVRLVLHNLIHNGLKFTQQGSVRICSSEEGDKWRISVIDTGLGIGAEQLEKLRSNGAHPSQLGTRGERGTGLGLLVSKELVEQMGGKFYIESTPKIGSTFSFTLPKRAT